MFTQYAARVKLVIRSVECPLTEIVDIPTLVAGRGCWMGNRLSREIACSLDKGKVWGACVPTGLSHWIPVIRDA